MKNIVKTNVYRCLEYCPNCPFKDNGEAMHLEDGRVDSIKEMLLKSDWNSFTCHKTAHNLDNSMEPTLEQKPKLCYGAYKFLLEQKRPNIIMRIGMSREYRKEKG